MKSAAVFLLLWCCAVALPCHRAAAFSGTELDRSCALKDKAGAENSRCVAYVQGFIDGMIMGYTAHGTSRGYCPPVTGISVARGRAIIEKYLHDHPERLKTDASISAGLALSEAYPCREPK